MLSTEPRQMSTIEQFSLGSIILWQFTPFLMSAVINGEIHSNKKLEKKMKKNSHQSRTCEIISWTYICRPSPIQKKYMLLFTPKALIGNYESKKHIHKLYAMRSGRNVLARFQTENDFRHLVQHKKNKRKKKEKNVC